MTVKLTWTPGSGATTQTVQYRVYGATSWTNVVTNLDISVTQYQVTGLNDQQVYQFRVLTNCTGNPPSNVVTKPCPPPSITTTTITEQTCMQYSLNTIHPCGVDYVTVQYTPCGQTTPVQATRSAGDPTVLVCSNTTPTVVAGCGFAYLTANSCQ